LEGKRYHLDFQCITGGIFGDALLPPECRLKERDLSAHERPHNGADNYFFKKNGIVMSQKQVSSVFFTDKGTETT